MEISGILSLITAPSQAAWERACRDPGVLWEFLGRFRLEKEEGSSKIGMLGSRDDEMRDGIPIFLDFSPAMLHCTRGLSIPRIPDKPPPVPPLIS